MNDSNGTSASLGSKALMTLLVERVERVELLLQAALPTAVDDETAIAVAEAIGDLDELRDTARTFLAQHGAGGRASPGIDLRLLETRTEIARLEADRLRATRGDLIARSQRVRAKVEAGRRDRVVERAVGLLMARHGLLADEARASIDLAARHQNRSQTDVAIRVLLSHELAVHEERGSP